VLAWLDGWDPARAARVLRPLFSAGNPVGGRATWGRRPESWQALEDTTVIDALWDTLGVPRAPSRNVALDRAALEGEARHAVAVIGPASAGSYLSVGFEPAHTPVGPSLAPRAARVLGWADARWGLELGPLREAPTVR
jgi:hypothetical protein